MKKLITAGLNRYLECDPERLDELQKIEGKVVGLKVKEIDTTIFLRVTDHALESVEDVDVAPDVQLIVSMKALPDYFLGVDRNQQIKNGDIEIIGDTHVASIFHNTLREVEIDWEELLAARVGDTLAHQVGSGAKKVNRVLRTIRENVQLDTRDYLQDNLQVAVTQSEVDQFVQDVDTLRAQVDRLEARLKRLDTPA